MNPHRFSQLGALQKKIESTKYEPGWTMTGMAMQQALALYKKEQRKDAHTAKVTSFIHGSFGHRIKISDGEHRPDSAQCVLPCPLNAKKIMNKSS